MKKALDLSKVPLSGRSAEMKILDEAFDGLKNQANGTRTRKIMEVVYIEAPTGTGKSFLVNSWHQQQLPSTLLVSGKFDQHSQSNQPYAAIVEALNQLCFAVDKKTNNAFRYCVRNTMVEEIKVLVDLIPYLQLTLAQSSNGCYSYDGVEQTKQDAEKRDQADANVTDNATNCDLDNRSTQFNMAIQSLLICISEIMEEPYIMMIDDVQWADENSLILLQALLAAFELGGFMLILAARPIKNWAFLPKAENALQATGRSLHKMSLENLTVEQVNNIISTVTELSPVSTMLLSKIVYEKTKGNPHFVLHFITLLNRRELIYYCMQTYGWCWDEDIIRGHSDLADNVAAIVLERIQAMDKDTQDILQLASYLGASFEVNQVAFLVQGMELVKGVVPLTEDVTIDKTALPLERVEALLQNAVLTKLIDSQAAQRFKFSHSSVQQSFLQIPVDNIFLYRVGFVIRSKHKSEIGQHWMQFAAVQTLNAAMTYLPDVESRLILVRFNLQAAQNAMTNAAFFPASDYFAAGIKCANLLDAPWHNHYELMIRLYTRATIVECACGRHERVGYLTSVIFNKGQKFEDQVDAYISLANSLQAQAKLEEAFAVLLEALRNLGETFPAKPGRVSLALSARQTAKLLSIKDVDILSMPIIMDEKSNRTLKLLSMAFLNSNFRRDFTWQVLVSRRLVCRTVKLGLSKYAPLAFAVHAKKLANAGNFDEASRFGRIANYLINQLRVKENLPVTSFFLATYVDHLRNPLYRSLRSLNRALNIGKELGDLQGALLCATTILAIKTAVGSPLTDMIQESTIFFHQAKEYNQDNLVPEFLLLWQYAANLAGKTADPFEFDGAVMKEEAMMKEVTASGGQAAQYYKFLRMICFIYMGDWNKVGEVLDATFVEHLAHMRKVVASHYTLPLKYIFCGFAWFKIYAQTKDRKTLSLARFALKFLRAWGRKGSLNVVTGLWLVEAQQAAVDQDFSTVKNCFDQAISGLHRCGSRGLEALACESFAHFALEKNEQICATDYMVRAHGLYTEFEAFAKTAQIEREYDSLLINIDLTSFRHHSTENVRRFEASSVASVRMQQRVSWWSSSSIGNSDHEN